MYAMPSLEPLLTARRNILPIEHQQLRKHMPTINRLGDLGIKWSTLGIPGVTMLERGIYQRALKAAGRLVGISTIEVAKEMNDSLLPRIATARERLSTDVINVDYFGQGRFPSIGYVIRHDALQEERTQLTTWLDQKNGLNNDWGAFDPHISVATIDANNATEAILEAFWDIHPAEITVLPLVVEAR